MPAQKGIQGRTILVVDDDFDADLRTQLEQKGAKVIGLSCQQALLAVRRNYPHAAALDWHPTSGPRRALLRQLRKNDVPTLLLGSEPPPPISTGRDAVFVAKPCPTVKLIAAPSTLMR